MKTTTAQTQPHPRRALPEKRNARFSFSGTSTLKQNFQPIATRYQRQSPSILPRFRFDGFTIPENPFRHTLRGKSPAGSGNGSNRKGKKMLFRLIPGGMNHQLTLFPEGDPEFFVPERHSNLDRDAGSRPVGKIGNVFQIQENLLLLEKPAETQSPKRNRPFPDAVFPRRRYVFPHQSLRPPEKSLSLSRNRRSGTDANSSPHYRTDFAPGP